jgi:hypothetical protein
MTIPVELTGDGVSRQAAMTVDLSDRGMRLRTADDIPVGTRVQIEMRLPSRLLTGSGVVVRNCERPQPSPLGKRVCAIRLERPLQVS